MSNTEAIRHEHVKTIINTGNIIAMLNKAGIGNDKATEIAQEIDVQINAALDEKLNTEDVIKIVEEHLDGVATKEFVRAEIQGLRTEIQSVKAELQAEIQGVKIEIQTIRTEMQEVRTDMQKGLRQNLIAMVGFMSLICGVLYFALSHHV